MPHPCMISIRGLTVQAPIMRYHKVTPRVESFKDTLSTMQAPLVGHTYTTLPNPQLPQSLCSPPPLSLTTSALPCSLHQRRLPSSSAGAGSPLLRSELSSPLLPPLPHSRTGGELYHRLGSSSPGPSLLRAVEGDEDTTDPTRRGSSSPDRWMCILSDEIDATLDRAVRFGL